MSDEQKYNIRDYVKSLREKARFFQVLSATEGLDPLAIKLAEAYWRDIDSIDTMFDANDGEDGYAHRTCPTCNHYR